MTRTLATTLAAAALLLTLSALPPAPHGARSRAPLGPAQALAQVSKSRGAGDGPGAGGAARVGDRAAELGSGWAIPLTIFTAGVLLTAALVSRNIGAAVGVVLVAILALIFFASPDAIRQFAEGVGRAIF